MKKKTVSWIFAAAAVLLFHGISHAVSVVDYNQFETNLLLGNNIELTPLVDVIKANSNQATIAVPTGANLTITGNGRTIELNRILGNMMTMAGANTTVTMNSFTLQNGNHNQNGGAINITGPNSRLNIGGVASLLNNTSSLSGGAISVASNASLVFTGTTNFSNNTAGVDGGAISLTNGASADFSGTELTAVNNRAIVGNGGFLSAVGAGNISFGTATFVSNGAISTAGVNAFGGVIFSSGATNISFTKNASFLNNSAYSAGAMYITDGTIATFAGQNTLFQGNQSYDAVGALLIRNGARAVFQGETTIFRNNFMTDNRFGTGAVDVAYNAFADFTGTYLIAQGNNAGMNGWGGFMWSDTSNVLFGDALIGGESAGDGNVAYYGGGIYAGNNNNATFSGTAMFRNNRANVDGGAIYMSTNSVVVFTATSSSTFLSNIANNKGGAIAMTGESSLTFNTNDANFFFNTARLGGAVSIEGASTFEITNGSFLSNSASVAGGAVYMRGINSAQRSVFRSYTTTAGAGRTIFRGNTAAGGQRNAIYMDDYSSAYFDIAANSSVEMLDGITGSNNTTTYFEVSGSGNFNLYGTFDTIDLNSLGNFNLMAGSEMRANTVNNAAGARFSMQNGIGDTAYMRNLNNNGTLAMDIFAGSHDRMVVSENVTLNSGTSILEVKADDMTNTNFRKRIYKLINYDTYTGSFSGVNIVSPVAPVSSYLGYGDAYANWITLAMLGSQSTTQFSNISGESFNQKEAAKALDRISGTVVNNDPWDLALAEIETYTDEGIKNILSHLSGYFLANVIRNAAADSPNNEIYDRIKNHCLEGHTISNGFWVQARGGVETFKENDNSIDDYKDTSVGVMAGYDRFMDDKNLMLGIYGRFNSDSIEQGRHEADGKKMGVGVYGGYIKPEWELKALTLVSFDSFDTKRYIPYAAATAEGEIKATTLSLDLEGALKFDMTFTTTFRPYAGFEFANSTYKGFTESGAGIYNLDVDGGNYLRTSGRIGAGIQYEEDIWSFYGNLEGKLLLTGTEPEIESVFEGTNATFKTRGSEEGSLQLGGGIGGSVRLTEGLKLFANANVYGADKYQNIYGNIGLRYTFCNIFSYKKAEPVVVPPPVLEPVKYVEPEPVLQRSEDIDMYDDAVVEAQKLEAQKRREKPMLKSYSLNMASFDVGKSNLKEAAKKDIAREAEEIKQFDFKRIIIEGHTDSTGSNNLNKELSKARAKAVYDEFASHGIPEEKMMYIGFGPSMPRDTNKTSEGRANNRRVEIFVD